MAGMIKLFQSVRNSYQTMGIYSPHPNWKKLFIWLSLVMAFISRFGYFVFEAKFAEENGFQSFYETFLVLIVLGVFLQELWQMPEILQLIEMFDDFIKRSKSAISSNHIRNTFCSFSSMK